MTTSIIRFYSRNGRIAFGQGANRDFTLQDYLSWDDDVLELRHDYIQRVFPLPEFSGFNYNAPQVTRPDYDAFRSDPSLRSSLRQAFDRICRFYGLVPDRTSIPGNATTTTTTTTSNTIDHNSNSVNPDPITSASPTPTPPPPKPSLEAHETETPRLLSLHPHARLSPRSPHHWLVPFNHNHLRITRIIRSLRVLGLADEASLFLQTLLEIDRQAHATESQDGGVVSARSRQFWTRAGELPLCVPPDPNEAEVQWLKGI